MIDEGSDLEVDFEEDNQSDGEKDEIDYQSDDEGLFDNMEQEKPMVKTVPGLVYLSYLPPKMTPLYLRQIFSKYGEVGRIYLQPGDNHQKRKRKMKNTYNQGNYSEGWIEFADKKLAKKIVLAFHNTLIVDGKKGQFADCLWNLKYLSRFRWTHLTESLRQEQQNRKQRQRIEMEQAKREVEAFSINVRKSKASAAIQKHHESKGIAWQRRGRPINYKQRKTVDQLRLEKKQKLAAELGAAAASVDENQDTFPAKRKKVLGKIFAS